MSVTLTPQVFQELQRKGLCAASLSWAEFTAAAASAAELHTVVKSGFLERKIALRQRQSLGGPGAGAAAKKANAFRKAARWQRRWFEFSREHDADSGEAVHVLRCWADDAKARLDAEVELTESGLAIVHGVQSFDVSCGGQKLELRAAAAADAALWVRTLSSTQSSSKVRRRASIMASAAAVARAPTTAEGVLDVEWLRRALGNTAEDEERVASFSIEDGAATAPDCWLGAGAGAGEEQEGAPVSAARLSVVLNSGASALAVLKRASSAAERAALAREAAVLGSAGLRAAAAEAKLGLPSMYYAYGGGGGGDGDGGDGGDSGAAVVETLMLEHAAVALTATDDDVAAAAGAGAAAAGGGGAAAAAVAAAAGEGVEDGEAAAALAAARALGRLHASLQQHPDLAGMRSAADALGGVVSAAAGDAEAFAAAWAPLLGGADAGVMDADAGLAALKRAAQPAAAAALLASAGAGDQTLCHGAFALGCASSGASGASGASGVVVLSHFESSFRGGFLAAAADLNTLLVLGFDAASRRRLESAAIMGYATAFESAARGGISAAELRYYYAQATQLLALQLLARNPPATPANAPMVGRVLQALADHAVVE